MGAGSIRMYATSLASSTRELLDWVGNVEFKFRLESAGVGFFGFVTNGLARLC